MKVSKEMALAGALVLTAGLAPSGIARGQESDSQDALVRAIQIGRGSRIGVTVLDLEESDKKDVKAGVVVDSVSSGGPGDKAGIKAGDVITEFDGDRVRTVRQFQRLVQESASGRAVPVVLSRGGQRVTVTVTPETRGLGDDFGARLLDTPMAVRPALPQTPVPPRPPTPPPALNWFSGDNSLAIITSRGRLGTTTEQVSGQLAEYFGVKEGALVKSVQDGSAASKAGIKAGDIITSINGSHVYDPSDVSRAVNRLDDGAEFTVEVVRDHKTQTLKGKVEAPARRRSGVRT